MPTTETRTKNPQVPVKAVNPDADLEGAKQRMAAEGGREPPEPLKEDKRQFAE